MIIAGGLNIGWIPARALLHLNFGDLYENVMYI